MALLAFEQFSQSFRFAVNLIINGHRLFSFVHPILNNHIANVTFLIGADWENGLVHQMQELERLSGSLHNL